MDSYLAKKYGKDWKNNPEAVNYLNDWKDTYEQIGKDHPQNENEPPHKEKVPNKVSLDNSKETPHKEVKAQANLDEEKTPKKEKKVVKAKKPTAQVSLDVPDNYDYTSNRAPRMSEITQAGKDLQSQAGANNKGSDQGKINEADWLKATTPDKKELYDLLSKHADLVYKDPDENANAKQAIRNKLDNGTQLKDFFGLGRGGRHGVFGSMLPFLYANADKVHDLAQRYGLNLGRIISNSKIAQTRHPKSPSKEKQVENKKPEEQKTPETKKEKPTYIDLKISPQILQTLKQLVASGKKTKDDVFTAIKGTKQAQDYKDDDIKKWIEANI